MYSREVAETPAAKAATLSGQIREDVRQRTRYASTGADVLRAFFRALDAAGIQPQDVSLDEVRCLMARGSRKAK